MMVWWITKRIVIQKIQYYCNKVNDNIGIYQQKQKCLLNFQQQHFSQFMASSFKKDADKLDLVLIRSTR